MDLQKTYEERKMKGKVHNFQNFDSHLIFREIGKNNFKINVIPKIIEKYTSSTIKKPKEKDIKAGVSQYL